MKGLTLGFGITGSFCTHARALKTLKTIAEKEDCDIIPIFSETVCGTDTRFGRAEDLRGETESITGHKVICSIREAEPFGPACPLDVLLIAPCTGNTLAKIALGITDTAVAMAAKAHLRSDRPLVIALATNDAMSANLKNIGTLLSRKNVYFVPMVQDDVISKPHSLVADFTLAEDAVRAALRGEQLRPLFLVR